MTEETPEIRDPEGLLKAYEKAKEDLVALRAQLKALEEEKETYTEAVGKWKQLAVKAQALSALQADGIKDGERLLKHIDLSDVDLDEESNVKGLSEKLDNFKKDFPELFDPKKRAGQSRADIHEAPPAAKQLTSTEAQVARLLHH